MTQYTVTTVNDDAYDSGDLATELADGGGLSLRAALHLARAWTDADRIVFDPTLAGQTVNVTHFLPVIEGNVTIDGEAHGITISGGGVTRIFFVGGQTAGTNVTISNLTLANGYAKGGDGGLGYYSFGGGLGAGGAVFVRTGAAVALDDVTFAGNGARGGAGQGSGPLVFGGGSGGGLGGDGMSGPSVSSVGTGGGGAFDGLGPSPGAAGAAGGDLSGGGGRGGNGGAGGFGGDGADRLDGGADDDIYVVDNSGDRVVEVGGAGYDSVDTSLAAYTLDANVERFGFSGKVAAGNAVTIVAHGNALDNWMDGSAGHDSYYGGEGIDVLWGNVGNNTLFGEAGSDQLIGGAGADVFVGGAGGDRLYGFARTGNDATEDVFRYASISDSGVAALDRDIIYDLEDGIDTLDLAFALASSVFRGTSAFVANGTSQVRWQQVGTCAYVYADTNGDALADFSIRLIGTHALTVGDLHLGL